jgi:hypothetical protein
MTNHRIWTLKSLCIVAMLAGTVWVGLPAFAQISIPGTGIIVNTSPVISVPGASPIYTANAGVSGSITSSGDFSAWVSANAAVQVDPGNAITPRYGGQSVFVEYRFFVTDPDGTADIKDAQVKLLKPNGDVHTAYTPAISLGASSNITKEYYAQFELKYYDPPAINTHYYKIVVKVADKAIQDGNLQYVDDTLSPKLFQYNELTNIDTIVDSIDLGSLKANTKSNGVAVTIRNMGNTPADDTISATDLVKGSDTILATRIWYGPNALANGTSLPAADANAKRDAGFNLAPGATASRIAYFAVDVPKVTPLGTYTTTITLTGVPHSDTCSSDCTTVSWS